MTEAKQPRKRTATKPAPADPLAELAARKDELAVPMDPPQPEPGEDLREQRRREAAERAAKPNVIVSEPDAVDGGDVPNPLAGVAHDQDGTG